MTAPNLQAIEARLAAATPGPWGVALGSGSNMCTAVVCFTEDGGATFVADCLPDWALSSAEADHRPNMDLIANAPTDLAWLLTENTRLQAEADTARTQLLEQGRTHITERFHAEQMAPVVSAALDWWDRCYAASAEEDVDCAALVAACQHYRQHGQAAAK